MEGVRKMRKEFERVSPESVGLRSADILSFIDDLEHSETEMHGLMIMRHGKVCAEGWWAPFAPNLRHGLQSHTKTYAATAVGIAYTEGILRLDERLIDIFPDESPEEPSENLKLLTVRDVLCMGCGMDTMPMDSEHWIRDFMHTPVNHKPGTTYMYNSTGSTMLGAIVRKKTGEGLHEYLSKRLFCKIGIDADNLRWLCMADGMEIGGGGLYATTEDNLRLMKLYADGGVWEGERILAEDYVKLAVSNQNESATESINNPLATDNFLGYGFQIWMCKPEGVYRADGAMGQFTIVCPKQDMIIAINETAVGAHWAQNTLNIVWDYLAKVDAAPVDEDTKAADRLVRKLAALSLPNPVYRPASKLASEIGSKEWNVTSGVFSFEMFNFMAPKKLAEIKKFSFKFDNYGCVLKGSGETDIEVRIATNGSRFINIVGKTDDCTQVLACDGAWVEENVFALNARWVETCFVKKFLFRFDGNKVTIEEDTVGMMPGFMGKPEPAVAVCE